jgi:hypothetical protein
LRQVAFGLVSESTCTIILKQIAACTHLAGNEDIEIIIVVDIYKFEFPRPFYQDIRHTIVGSVGKVARPVVKPQPRASALVILSIFRPPIGQHYIQVAVTIHITKL